MKGQIPNPPNSRYLGTVARHGHDPKNDLARCGPSNLAC
jgi:hypothetical protein